MKDIRGFIYLLIKLACSVLMPKDKKRIEDEATDDNIAFTVSAKCRILRKGTKFLRKIQRKNRTFECTITI